MKAIFKLQSQKFFLSTNFFVILSIFFIYFMLAQGLPISIIFGGIMILVPIYIAVFIFGANYAEIKHSTLYKRIEVTKLGNGKFIIYSCIFSLVVLFVVLFAYIFWVYFLLWIHLVPKTVHYNSIDQIIYDINPNLVELFKFQNNLVLFGQNSVHFSFLLYTVLINYLLTCSIVYFFVQISSSITSYRLMSLSYFLVVIFLGGILMSPAFIKDIPFLNFCRFFVPNSYSIFQYYNTTEIYLFSGIDSYLNPDFSGANPLQGENFPFENTIYYLMSYLFLFEFLFIAKNVKN